MKNILLILIGFITIQTFAQNKNFIDQPFLETIAEIDTLVTPDKIHLVIMLNEEDNRNRKSTEELEASMLRVLNSLKIDLEKNLSLLDYSSDFKKYFLSGQTSYCNSINKTSSERFPGPIPIVFTRISVTPILLIT